MTPQEREVQKFYYSLNAGVEGGGHQEIDEQQDMDRIIDLLAQTRRAALLEAVEFLKLMPMLTKDNAIAVLTKLAQEG